MNAKLVKHIIRVHTFVSLSWSKFFFRKRTSFEPQSLSKRFASESVVDSRVRTTDNKLPSKVDRTNRNRSRTFTISTEEIYSAWGYRARPGHIAADPDVLKELEKRTRLKKSESVDNNVMRTKDNYHISFYEPVAENIEIDTKKELLKRAQNQLTGTACILFNLILLG